MLFIAQIIACMVMDLLKETAVIDSQDRLKLSFTAKVHSDVLTADILAELPSTKS